MDTRANMPTLADQLREAVVSPRHELSISRHRFRAGPAYVLRDPVTFKTHRLDPEDYRILSALDQSATLGETFSSLVERGVLASEDEGRFYEFIVALHQRNLLSLPLSDGAVLYERFERRQRAERISRVLGVFFMRLPLVNPDRFLTRTMPMVRWLFSTPAFAAWVVLAMLSLVVVAARWGELTNPVAGVFTGGNILLLWSTLIGLKVVHEFGHAYACKAFGGHVPEMGAFLVIFTPLAYVDATDSWSFTRTRHRAIVTLAGVYFESIVGIAALFVWAITGPSVLNTLAYQTVLLATVTTALFNLNPLLRYDAYYLVSDLTGVPNLRARCENALSRLAKHLAFGIRPEPGTPRHSAPLLAFGSAQLAYRVMIMATIATVLVMKFGGPGVAMAVFIIGLTLGRALLNLFRYIRTSEEMAGRRLRGAGVVAATTTLATAAVLLVPLPWPVHARGFSTFENVETIHAPSDGFIRGVPHRVGAAVEPNDLLMVLDNESLVASQRATLAGMAVDRAEVVRASLATPADVMAARAGERASSATLARLENEVQRLRISATSPAHVLTLFEDRLGAQVRRGDPLVTIGAGRPEAVFLLGEAAMERLRLSEGDRLEFRSPAAPTIRYQGRVRHIARTGSRQLDARATPMAVGLEIPLDPDTMLALEPQFEISLTVFGQTPPPNATLVARVPTRPMTSASVIHRRFASFMNKIKRGFSDR